MVTSEIFFFEKIFVTSKSFCFKILVALKFFCSKFFYCKDYGYLKNFYHFNNLYHFESFCCFKKVCCIRIFITWKYCNINFNSIKDHWLLQSIMFVFYHALTYTISKPLRLSMYKRNKNKAEYSRNNPMLLGKGYYKKTFWNDPPGCPCTKVL